MVLPQGLSHNPQSLWCQHQVLISCLAPLKKQWALVFLCFHRARFQQDRLPGWLCEQPQCSQEEKGALGRPPSSRVQPYGGKPSAHSQTTSPPSPQVCNAYGSMALSQAAVFDIRFAEAGAPALPLCPTMDAAGSLSNATIYSSELHFERAPRLCWLPERVLV